MATNNGNNHFSSELAPDAVVAYLCYARDEVGALCPLSLKYLELAIAALSKSIAEKKASEANGDITYS